MVRKCDVPNCKERKLSLFSVPKNVEERQKWRDILQCTLNEKAYVCEKHFSSSSVKSNFTSQTENGVVIYTRQFQRKRLRKSALPNKLGACFSENKVPKKIKKLLNVGDVHKSNLSSPRRVSEQNKDQNCIDSHNINQKDVVDSRKEYKLSKKKYIKSILIEHNYFIINHDNIEHCGDDNTVNNVKSQNPLDEFMFLQEPSSDILNIDVTDHECEKTESNFSWEEQNANNSEDLYLCLLEKILSDECDVKLPSKNWGIHKCIESKSLMFTYCEMIPSSEQQDKLIPTCFKRVGFGPTIEVYFLYKDIKITSISKPTTVEELQDILLKIDSYNICPGGPSTKYYRNVYTECAIKVNSRWRHRKCPVILEKGNICKHCVNLHSLLSRCVDNQRKRKYRIRLSVPQSNKGKIMAVRKRGTGRIKKSYIEETYYY